MAEHFHDFYLAMDVFEVVLVGEDLFLYHFDSSRSAIGDGASQEDRSV